MDKSQENIITVIKELTCLRKSNAQYPNDKYPCKKTLQKIIYLIQQAGDDLGFEYSIHFYGPYSADLDYQIHDMNAQGMLNIQYTNYGHLLSVPDDFHSGRLTEKADRVIHIFGSKTPSDLELLATTLFVQRETSIKDKESIINGVIKIKGSKYSKKEIEDAIQILQNNDYFDNCLIKI